LSLELRRSQRRSITRAWRLAASVLCVLEAASLGRAFSHACVSVPQAAMLHPGWPGALPPPLGAAVRILLPSPSLRLSGTGSVLLQMLSDAVRPLAHVAASVDAIGVGRRFSGAVVSRVAAAAYGCYFMWWHAFPAEALTRRQFRASLLPMWQPVSTGGTWLLQRLRVASAPLGGDELIRRISVSAAPRRPLTESDEDLGHPFPSFLSRQTQPEEGRVAWREQVG
jgi:hypothetical protein